MSESTLSDAPILSVEDLGFSIFPSGSDEEVHLLRDISVDAPRGHFMAIVGPSGCGKTTFLKCVAGITESTDGTVRWEGRDLEEEDFEPSEVAYVPQFSIAYDEMTVGESIECAARLQLDASLDELDDIIDDALEKTGLVAIEDRLVKVLSGGQKRRLGLAMELVADPDLLLCDEVTSGLDPKSENEIVDLLHSLSRSGRGRLVASVTHSLSNLDLYDSVLVLFAGQVVYHGPPRALPHYFSVESVEDVYPQLAKRDPKDWFESWQRRRDDYYQRLEKDRSADPGIAALAARLAGKEVPKEAKEAEAPNEEKPKKQIVGEDSQVLLEEAEDDDHADEEDLVSESEARAARLKERETEGYELPGFLAQFWVLFVRRWKRFFRDRTNLFLHLALLFGFPILVIIFAPTGIPQVERLPDAAENNLAEEARIRMQFTEQKMNVGKIVSGLVMFQVVLLTLMGANNSAREIAGERAIFEKEKFAGLRPSSYLASKVCFLAILVCAQALWMGIFVDAFARIPGDAYIRYPILILVCGGMTAICLGISALMKSADQANLLSIYLVGFQLPLSGAILGLPKVLEPIIQPFISAFWGWSGTLASTKATKYYDAVKAVSETDLEQVQSMLCMAALGGHLVIGLIMAAVGLSKNRWEY